MGNAKRIVNIFTRKQKWKLVVLFFLTIIGSGLELMGVSAIMPFVNVVVNPQSIGESRWMQYLYEQFHMTSVSQFLIFLALALVAIYICKNLFLIYLYNYQFRFTYQGQKGLECKLLSCYMQQDYTFHLTHNSAVLQRNILQDVTGFFQAVLAFLQLLTEGLVCLALFVYLFLVDMAMTMGVVVFVGAFMLVFLGYFRKKIDRIGEESHSANAKRMQWVQQSLGGIKEVKILSRERFFMDNYEENAGIYADRQQKYQLSAIVPRPIMEMLGISGLLLMVTLKLLSGDDISRMLPILSVFTIAAFRLLPSFGRLSGCMGALAFNRAAINEVCTDIEEVEKLVQKKECDSGEESALPFEGEIRVEKVSFRYPNTEKNVLENVELCIPKNKSVAFVGPSGAGKTTMADIILGVLEPQEGHILVDGQDIYRHLQGWYKKIGYIPQSIYLMDDTIRKNVAFGVAEEDIDDDKVKEALKEAQLLDFIEGIPEGLDTFIGERGIKLSGGQRQRIGIARALYNDPEILVLDEATSSLDNETEKAIMEAIEVLQGSKTLLIIAHRLSTIQNCDFIYEIKDGKAVLKKEKG